MTFHAKHILVPVAVAPADDMSMAEHLVDVACDFAHTSKGRITLVYVDALKRMPVPVDAGFAPPPYSAALSQAWEASRAEASDRLAQLKTRAEAKGVVVMTDILEPVEGVGEAIAHAARNKGCDMIVVCSHGRRGLKRLFLGSVAERVAHLSTVPVLITR